jgi:hypothetical protein
MDSFEMRAGKIHRPPRRRDTASHFRQMGVSVP